MIDEPQGAFMCRSSIVLGLSISAFFHGLLLTVFESQCDFHDCRTPRCAYMLVVKTRSLAEFGPFHGLLLSFGAPK